MHHAGSPIWSVWGVQSARLWTGSIVCCLLASTEWCLENVKSKVLLILLYYTLSMPHWMLALPLECLLKCSFFFLPCELLLHACLLDPNVNGTLDSTEYFKLNVSTGTSLLKDQHFSLDCENSRLDVLKIWEIIQKNRRIFQVFHCPE